MLHLRVAAIAGLLSLPLAAGAQDADPVFDPANFDETSTIIDNPYLPLTPGTQFVYEGTALEDDELVERRIVSTVSGFIKEINGVDAVVFWERDFNEGLLIESELAFFAQDKDGNVWHLGQYRETYDEEEFVGGRAWMVGHLEGAEAGVFMWADPQAHLGAPSYSQGFAPEPFNWTDRASVAEIGQQTCVPVDCYDDVLVTEEEDDENPGAFQLKYYAPGVGNVRVGYRGDDPEEEELELVEVKQLDPAEWAEADTEALALETRAYTYSSTPAAELLSTDQGE